MTVVTDAALVLPAGNPEVVLVLSVPASEVVLMATAVVVILR